MSDSEHPLNGEREDRENNVDSGDGADAVRTECTSTPGDTGVSEDLPEPPALPDDHPLNAGGGMLYEPVFLDSEGLPGNNFGCTRREYRFHVDIPAEDYALVRMFRGSHVRLSHQPGDGPREWNGVVTEVTASLAGNATFFRIHFYIRTDDLGLFAQTGMQVRIADNELVVEPTPAHPACEGGMFVYDLEPRIEWHTPRIAVYDVDNRRGGFLNPPLPHSASAVQPDARGYGTEW